MQKVSHGTDGKSILSSFQTFLIVCFAFTGNCAVLIAYGYPAGFYLEFLKDNDIPSVIGTIAVTLGQITTVIGPSVVNKLASFKRISIKTRSTFLCLVSGCCSASLLFVDRLVSHNVLAALVLIGVSRAVMGFLLGIFFVIVQGEIVDRYFKDNKTVMVIIGSGVYAGNTLGGIIGTEVFIRGGWRLIGPVAACFNILPLIFLPFMCLESSDYSPIRMSDPTAAATVQDHGDDEELVNCCQVTSNLTWSQTAAFYVPDFVFFMNNISFSVLAYVVPAKMYEFKGMPLDRVVFELNMICCVSIFLGLAFSYWTSKKLHVLGVMMGCNILFYCGCLMMYASTTRYSTFHYDFEVSSLMVGFADATITNLVIMSKFDMFERWNVDSTSVELGQYATNIFNISDSLGYIVGAIISGLMMPKSSEVPTFTSFLAYLAVTSVTMTFCCLVKGKKPLR